MPLIALGGDGRFVVVPLEFSELAYDQAKGVRFDALPARAQPGPPFQTGLVGLLSYDQFARTLAPGAGPRIFRVDRALVEDRVSGEVVVTGTAFGKGSAFAVPAAVIDRVLADRASPPNAAPLIVDGQATESEYLQIAEQALADIRRGRYYQINLLRYFAVRGEPQREQLAARLDASAGGFAAVFDVPGLSLWSFSPERFLKLSPGPHGVAVETWPIKGTAPRSADPTEDRRLAERLAQSPKDLAELHMIVDLMRNDLHRVSRPASVRVLSPNQLLSVANVHHLVAHVAADLRPGLSLGELLAAVCPGGSVTGAPKREVMEAIRTYEGRERGYFMGHAFYLDDSGAFDSSILIRTVARTAAQGQFEFAAGSGIVMRSQAEAELREIDAKTRILSVASARL